MKNLTLPLFALAVSLGCTQLIAPVANVNFVSVEQERELGEQFARDVESKQKVLRDPVVADYVSSLGRRLESTVERRDFPFTFRVIEDPTVNAFNIGGGYDPRESLAMFEILQKINQTEPGRVGALFSSHPPTGERIENVRREIESRPLPADLYRDSRAFQEVRKRIAGQ